MAASTLRRIARWKIVGGAFVHFALPLYIVAAIGDALRLAAQNPAVSAAPGAGAIIAGVLRDSLPGLAAYALIGLAATVIAAAIDGMTGGAPRAGSDALALARGRLGSRGDAAIVELTALPVDDPRARALVDHATALVTSSLRAIEAGTEERREAIVARAVEALETLVAEACALRAEAGAVHDAEAATLAGFVAARYGRSGLDGPSDSAGE